MPSESTSRQYLRGPAHDHLRGGEAAGGEVLRHDSAPDLKAARLGNAPPAVFHKVVADPADSTEGLARLGNRCLDHPDRPLMKFGRIPAL